MSAFINAAAQASSIDPIEIRSRNEALNVQLQNKQLSTIDVEGDRKCFFRAMSVILYGYQHCRAAPWKKIARHVDEQTNLSASSNDIAALHQLATYIRMDSTWAGEDVISAAANPLSRSIHEYFAVSNNSPLKYLPAHAQVNIQSSLLLAFYESGHYRSETA